MKTTLAILLVLSAVPVFTQEAILIRNGTIVPVVGAPIPGGDLLIEKGKISAIGTGLAAPAGAMVLDASGQYVYPGMVAPLTALGLINPPGSDSDINEKGLSVPQIDPYDALNPEDDSIEVARIDGVTTALTAAGTGSLINGKAVVIHLDGNLAAEMILKRNVLLVFNTTARQANSYPSTLPGVLQFLREKLSKAREYGAKREGGKNHERDAEMEALQPVLNREKPVLFQCGDEVSIRLALTLINEFSVRGIIATASADVVKFAALLAQKGIPLIWSGTTAIPRRWEAVDLNYHVAAVLAEKGVRFCFNESRGQGSRGVRRLPVPAAISVAYGLGEEEALRALTIRPAEILGIDHLVGSLEKGKIADVVVCSKPLLQLSAKIRAVIIRGRLIPLSSIQTRLRDKYQAIVRERLRRGESQGLDNRP